VRTLRPALAVFCVGLFLGAQLGTSFHLAFEPHAVCPEHGEIVHGDAHAVAPDLDDGVGLSAAEPHAHDECIVVLAPREVGQADLVAELDPPQTQAVDAPRAIPPGPASPRATPRYAFAPKQSPPA